MLIGYSRTSTAEQVAGLDAQTELLRAAGCEKIFAEQVSSVAQRDQLDAALDFVRDGDRLVVTKLDRLARSTADALQILNRLQAKGVALQILDFGGSAVDTGSASGKLVFTMFSAFAEFERAMMLERQRDGIAKAKGEGKYKGRKPTARAKSVDVLRLHGDGQNPSQIAKALGIGRASVYRIIGA
jgi:DNA invertase Pin-like site-specific DNA recombinase